MIQDFPYLIDGVVVDTADPQEMGRLKVWCPAVDGNDADLDTLPWATYVSPLAGQAHNYPAGGRGAQSVGPVSYGFWAIPKIGAQVVIGFLYGDYNQRIYVGSFFRDHGNRSLPAGRNVAGAAPQSDSFETIEPTKSNLAAQFQNNLSSSIAQTRGAYERQAAQAADEKTTSEGYDARVVKAGEEKAGALDPQTYCITTPGRHAIIMQDHPAYSRLRFKTAEGHQIIFDDANERIYVSTSRGRTWLELDVDGHVSLYGAESISMSAGADFNISAGGNVNIAAKNNINISAAGSARIAACSNMSIGGNGSLNIESGGSFDILAAAVLRQSGSKIHLNGAKASGATCPDTPSVVPTHEPWSRPTSKITRGPNWKE